MEVLKGFIPSACWRYVGQEHATPNQEREKLDALLLDSNKDIFDAVIVDDTSRWSRDNLKSKIGLEILRKNGIKFFVGTMEYDLFNPNHNVMLGMSAEFAEFQSKLQTLKIMQNKIERARRGWPTAGSKPFGRIFNRETEKWSIDPKKQLIIQQAAERYLNGESIHAISRSFGMKNVNLWKTLKHRSGDKWVQRFRSKALNIDQTVEINIPRLLDQKIIDAIHKKAEANKTYTHGHIKNKYLLSRMIFCKNCGSSMFGQTNPTHKRRYYRHQVKKEKGCFISKFVPADLIENSVLIHLVQIFGDPQKLEKAILRATPDLKKVQKLSKEHDILSGELKKVNTQKSNLINLAAEGALSSDDIMEKMTELKESENLIVDRLSAIKAELENTPDPEKIKRLSKWGQKVIHNSVKNNPKIIFKRSYEWKRNLIEHAFSGKDSQGKRYGVYMSQTGKASQPWEFEIIGALENTLLGLPLNDAYLEDAFNLDPEYQDTKKELKAIKTNITKFNLL